MIDHEVKYDFYNIFYKIFIKILNLLKKLQVFLKMWTNRPLGLNTNFKENYQ